MSKRSDRREADRVARKLAYQQLRQQPTAAAQVTPVIAPPEPDILARGQAFFQQDVPKPISVSQLQANRANAQLSSGPATAAGKAISSRNNTRHGLTADAPEGDTFQVLANESQKLYHQSLADFRKEWKPTTATEHDLVNRLVMHKWLRLRALRLQAGMFDSETGELTDTKKFDLYRRYETQHERSYNKAFADMVRLRNFQLRQQNGFESQQRKNEEHAFKIRYLQIKEDQLNAKQSGARALPKTCTIAQPSAPVANESLSHSAE